MSSSSKYIFGHAIMFLMIFRNFIKCYRYISGHFFLFWFYGLFKVISFISSRSLIKGGRKTGVPEEKPPDVPLQNLASHMWPERGGERPND